jgi:hypothetical protein
MPLFAGCHVIAVEALMPNAARALQTFAAAPPSEKFGSWLQRLHVFNNAVGNTRGNVTLNFSPSNPGASRVGAFDPMEPDMHVVSSVVMEDLLYHTPPAQRPHITLGDGSVVPLQPRHVYMVKVELEGYDVAALHGLRRLLMEDERPAAVQLQFLPMVSRHTAVPCDAVELTRFMYGQGYVYEDVLSADEMADSVSSAVTSGAVFEGWWRQRSVQEAVASAALVKIPASTGPLSAFCGSNAALEGPVGSSRFKEVVGDAVRAAAVSTRPASGTGINPIGNAALASFLDGLSKQAPCHWARYTALPLPDGVTMSACTHDPKVDTVISAQVHLSGQWFARTTWSEFAAMLDSSGSCPPDRPVVLDLGLNIG